MATSEMPRVNIVEPRTIASVPRRPATITGNSAKDQKNIVNSSKVQAICGKATKAIACKRVSRRGVSEPRRSTPSPVAFGRSISKERTFAEEKKRLEQVSPQCKKAANLTTRILKKGEFKSSEDLRKAIQRTVLGKKPEPPVQMAQKDCVMTYQKKGDSHKWTSLTTASQQHNIGPEKKCNTRNVEYKQITRCDRTNSVSSLARTNSTFSIDSASKPCEPIKCKFFGQKQLVKLGAFITSKSPEKIEKPAKQEKKVKETVKSTSPKTIKGKCHPVSTYLSSKRPVSNSKFKLVDRHRSLSPVRSADAYATQTRKREQPQIIDVPKVRSGPLERSKSQPPKIVEIMMPDEPTVIHVKPNLTPSLITYNSLPRPSRELKSVIHMRQISGAVFRTKSEGPTAKECVEEKPMDQRWSMSTPTLNVFEKHSDVCHYRNSDRFQELNQFYSNLERVGYLQKVTSQSDLRPIRRKEEVVDYELWKKIRMREKAQKELDFLVGQLKSNQKEKKIHFERDVDNIRWKEDSDPGLRHKSMSVENLKDFFQEKGLFAEKPPIEEDNPQPVSVTQAVDSYESHLGLSPKLISTLSPDQVLKLKNQLKQIYNGEGSSGQVQQEKRSIDLLPKRSLSLGPPRPPPIIESPVPNRVPKKFHTVTSITHLSENEKKHLTQSICSEIKEAVEQRRRHKSLDSTRSPEVVVDPPQAQSLEVDCLSPKDIKSKIHYFEKKPLELPGTTIYHARDATSSSDEEVMSVPPQVERPHVDQDLVSRRSHSFSDLKEIFGERNESFKCRSVSPSVRYVAVVDRVPKALVVTPAAANPSENCASPDADQRKSIISSSKAKIDRDVSWMAHKYENISSRGRCRKRRTISASSLIKQQDGLVVMPHIDIISKTASLQTTSRVCSPAPPVKKTGEVEKIRNFFESKNKSSLLGEMFTSEPDISKLRDVSVYLSGSWVAHQYPKKEDNFLSLRKVDSTKNRNVKKEKIRSISISPSRKMGILKQCIFPYKIFDDEKLASLPFPLNSDNLTSRRFTGTEKDAEKVLRKHKDHRCDINEG